ncbi:M1 family peptidase, partial [Streptomyces sp. NPDC059168]
MTPPRRQVPSRRTAVLRREAVLAAVPVALAALLGTAGPAAAGTTGAAGAGDPYFPLSGNGGYHVDHYDLTLRYDTASRHLDGTAVLTARATRRLTRFDLDLSGLKVTGVGVGGRRAAFRRDGQELVVTPPRTLRPGRRFQVT